MARFSATAAVLALAVCFTAAHSIRDLRADAAPHAARYLSVAPSANGDVVVDPHPARKIGLQLPPGWRGSIIPGFGRPRWWFPNWPGWLPWGRRPSSVPKFGRPWWWFPNWPGWLPWVRRPFHDHLPQVSAAPGPARQPPFVLP